MSLIITIPIFITKNMIILPLLRKKTINNIKIPGISNHRKLNNFNLLSVQRCKHKWLVVCWYYWEKSESNNQVVDDASTSAVKV
jgi:hypothetical protein